MFALANVASALALWGYKVLCVDWDLDAPGLTHYFNTSEDRKGLIELIADLTCENEAKPDWHDFTEIIDYSRYEGRLHLIRAGSSGNFYFQMVQNTDSVALYENHGLPEVLELLRTQWTSKYDFILLDSRTGVTDIGAICTMFMPDILFFVFTTSNQSLNGSIKTVNVLKRRAANLMSIDRRFMQCQYYRDSTPGPNTR